MKTRKIMAYICAYALAASLFAAGALPVFAAALPEEQAQEAEPDEPEEQAQEAEPDEPEASDGLVYVDGVLYNGYYMDNGGIMYIVSEGKPEPAAGMLSQGTEYYSCTDNGIIKLPKKTLYVKGEVYTGYYLNQSNKMYRAKKGTTALVTGIIKAGSKYYSYNAGKTQKMSKRTLYVKGKVYTGYYTDRKNKMYSVKKGTRKLTTGMVSAGTRYYSYKAGRMQKLSKQTVYVNGKAMEGMSAESLATLQRAQAVVAGITNDSMTKEQKLKVCFDFVKTYKERRPRTPHYIGMDWPVIYANDMFVDGGGNCCSYAAAFAYMAKAVGYEEVYCCNDSGHGWAEIDGLIYDPEWSMHHSAYSYYALSYNTRTDVNYKGNIAAGHPWMRIKI